VYSNRIPTITLIVFLNLTTLALAQTYYLDAVNGDDANPGTAELPWRTLQKAQTVLAEGDKVLLADGDYGEFTSTPNVSYDGDREDSLQDSIVNWITWEARPGHNPVLDRVVFTKDGGLCYLRYRFKDLKMRRIELRGIVACNVDHCEIVGPGDDIQYAYGGSVSLRSSSNISVSNCDIHFCSGVCISMSSCAHVTIADNQIYDVGADHFTLRTEHSDCYNIRIIGNTIRNTIWWDPDAHPDGIQFYASNGHNFRNCVFSSNTMYHMAVQGLFTHGSNGRFLNGLIENNLIYGCGSNALNIAHTTDTVFRNNTVLGFSAFSSSNSNLQIYNNIFYGSYVLRDVSVLGHHDYNIYSQDYTDWVLGSEPHTYMYPRSEKSVMLSELFCDPGCGDYSLRENCLAVDFCPAGSPAAVDDILARQRDSLPDAGCYEYMGTTPPPTDPPADDPPAEDPPTDDPPADDPPADDPPADDPPADDPPADDPPADDPPADDQPTDDSGNATDSNDPWTARRIEFTNKQISRENVRYNTQMDRLEGLKDRIENLNMHDEIKTRYITWIDDRIDYIEHSHQQRIESLEKTSSRFPLRCYIKPRRRQGRMAGLFY
jgi:hypothetical protein